MLNHHHFPVTDKLFNDGTQSHFLLTLNDECFFFCFISPVSITNEKVAKLTFVDCHVHQLQVFVVEDGVEETVVGVVHFRRICLWNWKKGVRKPSAKLEKEEKLTE